MPFLRCHHCTVDRAHTEHRECDGKMLGKTRTPIEKQEFVIVAVRGAWCAVVRTLRDCRRQQSHSLRHQCRSFDTGMCVCVSLSLCQRDSSRHISHVRPAPTENEFNKNLAKQQIFSYFFFSVQCWLPMRAPHVRISFRVHAQHFFPCFSAFSFFFFPTFSQLQVVRIFVSETRTNHARHDTILMAHGALQCEITMFYVTIRHSVEHFRREFLWPAYDKRHKVARRQMKSIWFGCYCSGCRLLNENRFYLAENQCVTHSKHVNETNIERKRERQSFRATVTSLQIIIIFYAKLNLIMSFRFYSDLSSTSTSPPPSLSSSSSLSKQN